jgi:hypothetical protein
MGTLGTVASLTVARARHEHIVGSERSERKAFGQEVEHMSWWNGHPASASFMRLLFSFTAPSAIRDRNFDIVCL